MASDFTQFQGLLQDPCYLRLACACPGGSIWCERWVQPMRRDPPLAHWAGADRGEGGRARRDDGRRGGGVFGALEGLGLTVGWSRRRRLASPAGCMFRSFIGQAENWARDGAEASCHTVSGRTERSQSSRAKRSDPASPRHVRLKFDHGGAGWLRLARHDGAAPASHRTANRIRPRFTPSAEGPGPAQAGTASRCGREGRRGR